MFLFTSFHCNCNIFNTDNIIPSVEFETIHHCEWRSYLTQKAGHTSQKAVNNPSWWSGCRRHAVQPEQCGKTSGCNYCRSESRRDTPRKMILADNRTATPHPAAAGVWHTSWPFLACHHHSWWQKHQSLTNTLLHKNSEVSRRRRKESETTCKNKRERYCLYMNQISAEFSQKLFMFP